MERPDAHLTDVLESAARLLEIVPDAGYLIVNRNQTRDFLDVVALAEQMGNREAAAVLAGIDDFYGDQRADGQGVATQLARQLAEPLPKDSRTTRELSRYRQLDERWHDWSAVTAACQELASEMLASAAAQDSAGRKSGS